MIVKKIILHCFLVFISIFTFTQLSAQDQIQKINAEYQRMEKFLYDYYTNDLQITEVVVKIDKEIVAISGTPDFRNREKAIGQIVLAISGAGMAAPWTKDICITVHIQGMPLGFIEVQTRNAMLASEGKISPEAFISSFITTQLTLPFDFPKDLLMPVINSAEIWGDGSITECNADKIEELLNVNAKDYLPEFLQAAYIRTGPTDGSQVCIAAVIDFENDEEAKEFFALNKNNSMNKEFYRIGTLVYIIEGSAEIVKMGIDSLKPKLEIVISEKVTNEKKDLSSRKFLIIGVGFIILLIIMVAIFMISGRYSKKQ